MKRVAWVASLLLAFAAGWWWGGHAERRMHAAASASTSTPGSAEPDASGEGPARAALPGDQPGDQPGEGGGVRGALSRGDWEPALEAIDLLARRGLSQESLELRNALFEQARHWAAAGRQPLAEALLQDYLSRNPHDTEGRLELSHVLQMRGLVEPAMEPLLEALRSTTDPAAVGRLRDALRLLVNVRETQLSGSQDLPGLIRFYEWLTQEDAHHDGHRLKLARWLLLSGRLDDAERVLDQTGLSGVTPEARDDLEAELHLARVGLPVRWEGRAMHVDVNAGGRSLRLLVDTGASTTALSRDAAAALQSRDTGRVVRVRTAGGLVSASVHRIRDLQVGELRLQNLDVLVLDQAPPGAQGLLGMDVLSRFPGGAGVGGLPGGLLGRPAPSG